MRQDHRHRFAYRPDDRPPPGPVTAACVVCFAALVLLTVSPALAITGAIAGCAAAVATAAFR